MARDMLVFTIPFTQNKDAISFDVAYHILKLKEKTNVSVLPPVKPSCDNIYLYDTLAMKKDWKCDGYDWMLRDTKKCTDLPLSRSVNVLDCNPGESNNLLRYVFMLDDSSSHRLLVHYVGVENTDLPAEVTPQVLLAVNYSRITLMNSCYL